MGALDWISPSWAVVVVYVAAGLVLLVLVAVCCTLCRRRRRRRRQEQMLRDSRAAESGLEMTSGPGLALVPRSPSPPPAGDYSEGSPGALRFTHGRSPPTTNGWTAGIPSGDTEGVPSLGLDCGFRPESDEESNPEEDDGGQLQFVVSRGGGGGAVRSATLRAKPPAPHAPSAAVEAAGEGERGTRNARRSLTLLGASESSSTDSPTMPRRPQSGSAQEGGADARAISQVKASTVGTRHDLEADKEEEEKEKEEEEEAFVSSSFASLRRNSDSVIKVSTGVR